MKKITRRSVLRLSGLAAASLALTSCRAAGSAAVGSRFSDWLRQKLAQLFLCILGGGSLRRGSGFQ